MRTNKAIAAVMAVVCVAGGVSALWAGTLARTTFDGRTLTTSSVANDTATNLNWTVDGLLDPGAMAARQEGGAGQSLFDGTTVTQNSFAPALNVGNNSTYWWTDVSIEVAPGSNVTITNVTFDYLAVNGGQAINVARASDFAFALYVPGFDRNTLADWPSGGQTNSTPLAEVFLDDVTNVSNEPLTDVSADFPSPIDLTLPGTYTLRIVAAEAPETGNHIGIDNLSINGTAGAPSVSGTMIYGK